VKVEIFRQVSSRLPRELLDRKIDFGLMAFEPVDRELEAFPVLKDELVLIMSPKHPLAGRSSVKVKELGNEPFVAHNVNTGSRAKVIETFARQHTPLNITLELATVETIKRFVQKRVGLAFVPRMCVREELARGVLVSVPVRGLTHNRTLFAAHRRHTHFSPAAAAFLKLLRKHTQKPN
jgi:DNA-binding transcriptional LysR family regulator